jgi:hypothetical protein
MVCSCSVFSWIITLQFAKFSVVKSIDGNDSTRGNLMQTASCFPTVIATTLSNIIVVTHLHYKTFSSLLYVEENNIQSQDQGLVANWELPWLLLRVKGKFKKLVDNFIFMRLLYGNISDWMWLVVWKWKEKQYSLKKRNMSCVIACCSFHMFC